MEAAGYSETSPTYHTTLQHISEDTAFFKITCSEMPVLTAEFPCQMTAG